MARARKTPTPSDSDSCQTCRFWKEDFDPAATERSGECRLNPPTVLFDGEIGVFCAHAQTSPTGWCGGHRQREQ